MSITRHAWYVAVIVFLNFSSNIWPGWLSVYQSGFLQRDVSIGNLLRLLSSVEMSPFSIGKLLEFRDVILSDTSKTSSRRDIVDKVNMLKELKAEHSDRVEKVVNDVVEDGRALERKLTILGVTGKCQAVILDGDLSAYIPTYFSSEHLRGALSVSTTRAFIIPV